MPAARHSPWCSQVDEQGWYQVSLVIHGDHRECIGLRSSAAERIAAEDSRGNKGVSWGSSPIMGLAQLWEEVSPVSSSCSYMASSTAGMDDNQAGSGPGVLHSCTAVLCDMGTSRG